MNRYSHVLKQSVNLPAIKTFFYVTFLNRQLLVPTACVNNLSNVSWETVRNRFPQIRYIVFDKDNTLTAPYSNSIHPVVTESVGLCLKTFGRSNIAIFSNSAGTPDDVDLKWKLALEQETSISVIQHSDKKPMGFQDVIRHFTSDPTKPIDAASVLVVGDRLLTDTVFGNLHGAITLHCTTPLSVQNDNPFARLIRSIENRLLQTTGNLKAF